MRLNTAILGFILIIIGFVVIGIGFLSETNLQNRQFGGLIMIGPIPIAFGTSSEITVFAMGIGLAIIILYIILYVLMRR
ncbi:MAG TPA: DUF131 domain-containing protein [Methanosarcinales archaeon]|nr:DUF131 domain-containing protein [Methanosarcinales archaeon]